MQLTDKQKLEMTETIARACGWRITNISSHPKPFIKCMETGMKNFEPFTDWNDAMRSADALFPEEILFAWNDEKGAWKAEVACYHFNYSWHTDRLTAFCLALVKIAKAKLEEE